MKEIEAKKRKAQENSATKEEEERIVCYIE